MAEPTRTAFVTPWSDSDDWVIDGQELVQPDHNPTHHLFFGDPSWTDYTFEADVKIIAGSEVALLFRARDPVHSLAAMLGGTNNTLHGLVARSETWPREVHLVHGQTTKNRWYRVRVEARGKTFKMFLDGKLLAAGDHEGYPRGCVGFAANPSARFRNVKVTDPSGKVLLEEMRDVLPKAKNAQKAAGNG